jgi:hypothetical protein
MDSIILLFIFLTIIFTILFIKRIAVRGKNFTSDNYKLDIKLNLIAENAALEKRNINTRINQLTSISNSFRNDLGMVGSKFEQFLTQNNIIHNKIKELELLSDINKGKFVNIKITFNHLNSKIDETRTVVNQQKENITVLFNKLQSDDQSILDKILENTKAISQHLTIINKLSLETQNQSFLFSELQSSISKVLNTSRSKFRSLHAEINNIDQNIKDSQTEYSRKLSDIQNELIINKATLSNDSLQIKEIQKLIENQISGLLNLRQSIGQFSFEKYLATISNIKENCIGINNRLSITQYTSNLTRSGLTIPKVPSNITGGTNVKHLEGLSRKDNFRNNLIFQSFDRQVNAFDLRQLEDYWLPKLQLTFLSRRALGYLAHNICLLEERCRGRYATNIQDALIRALVVRSISLHNPVSILEIGTLFGINIVCLWDVCAGLGQAFSATVIDPLDGYYGADIYDKITGLPVNENLFWTNIEAVKCPLSDIHLVKHLSTEKIALKSVQAKNYNCFIIDGDHSYEGISQDFQLYSDKLVRGGYLVIDDYNTEEWPDVTRFVDSIVRNHPSYDFVGADWRTIVFIKNQ